MAYNIPTAGPSVVNFGADPTKSRDSTAGFTAACAASKTIIVPPGSYYLNNFAVPNGTSIVGYAGIGFDTGTPNASAQIFALNSSTTSIFNVDNTKDVVLSGMNINGTGATTCNGVTAGGYSITLDELTIHNCTGWGIGGAAVGGTGKVTTSEAFINHCTVFSNGTGIGDLIDTWVTTGNISSNGTNIAFTAGNSGEVNVVNTRIEWSTTGYGFNNAATFSSPNPGSKVKFTNCQFDRNYNGAAYLNGCNYVQFNGCGFWRNGAVSASGSVSCHVAFNNASHILFTGCMSNYGLNDNSSGNLSPPVFARYSGLNSNIAFIGNDLTGYTAANSSTAWFSGTAPVNTYILKNNLGTGAASQDVDTRSNNLFLNAGIEGSATGSPGTLPTNWYSTGGAGLTQTLTSGTDVNTGLPYLGIQLAGTTSGTSMGFFFTTSAGTQVTVTPAGIYAFSVNVSFTAGSLTGLTTNLGSNTYISGVYSATTTGSNFVPTANTSTYTFTQTLGGTINGLQCYFAINYSASTSVAVTYRISNPQLVLVAPAGQNTQQVTATGQTIIVGGYQSTIITTNTGASMTGMILGAGSIPGQTFTIVNTTAFTIVFAAAASSNVFGTPTQAANVAQDYVWDGTNNLWRQKT